MARRTFADILASPPDVDGARLAATSEADIRRHAIEDGHDPDGEIDGYRLVLSPRAVRGRLGLTQTAFAAVLRVPIGTVRNWEQGRTLPDPAARSLLDALAAEPVAVLNALRDTAAIPLGNLTSAVRYDVADATPGDGPPPLQPRVRSGGRRRGSTGTAVPYSMPPPSRPANVCTMISPRAGCSVRTGARRKSRARRVIRPPVPTRSLHAGGCAPLSTRWGRTCLAC